MARMHDGITLPQGPSLQGLGIGLLVIASGVGAGVFVTWFLGVPLIGIGALFVGNGITGSTRIRVTHSKLLVEHDRPVRTFLIGARKERVAWSDYQGATVADVDGAKALEVQGAEPVVLGRGAPADELEHLLQLADNAAQRWREEQQLTG